MTVQIHLEGVVGDFLKGWAFDEDAPDTPVVVEVVAAGRHSGTAVADLERKDLESDDRPHTRIGFRFQLLASLLTGREEEFTVRVANDPHDTAGETRRLMTTRLAFATPAGKPWVESLVNPAAPIDVDRGEIDESISLFERGEIDEAIGLARRAFRANRDLFVVDTGIVDAVSRHVGVKTFEELMADRRHDWFETDNHSVWQRRLEKKEAMQRFARRDLVEIPRQIAHFSDPADLLDLDLPARYVAKPDGLASAKGVYAVSGGVNVFTGKTTSPERIVANWRRLATSTDRIDMFIVEEFVADRFAPHANVIPLDYKFYVFGGVAGFLEVFDRNHPQPSRTPYSLGWQPLPQPLEVGRVLGPVIHRPDNLQELIDVAERLGQDVGAFCRVDLFNGERGPVLGEITMLPANGKNRTPYANRLAQQAYVVFEDQQLWAVDR